MGPRQCLDRIRAGTARGVVQEMKCEDASRLVSEAQDRRLGVHERRSLRLHLWLCLDCRRFLRQIMLLRRALGMMAGRVNTGIQSPGLPYGSRERIRAALAVADGHSR